MSRRLTPEGRIQLAAAAALDRLPAGAKRRLSGRGVVRVDGAVLDPGLQLVLRMAALRGSPTFIRGDAPDPAAERRRIRREAAISQGVPTDVGAVRDLFVDGGDGPIGARHYAPSVGADGAPLLVYAHGGGWVVGDLDTHDELCRLLCRHAGVHVLAIDYALAPEAPFPAAVEDVTAAVRWALREAARLGADPARVAVGGDSAGGNLAAVACQRLAADPAEEAVGAGEARVALQVLVYPATDLEAATRSKELFAAGFYLDAHSRHWCERQYLGDGVDRSRPDVSPARGHLGGLPPAVVLTAAFDPLRDEGEAYAEALRAAGTRVVHHRADGMIHGFANMTGISRAARDAVMTLAGMVRAELATPAT